MKTHNQPNGAEDRLRARSERIRRGQRKAIDGHGVLGNGRIFGYTKRDKKLAIDEKQAEVVRELYGLYASGRYSFKQIEDILWDKGFRNLNGNKIGRSTMAKIIVNPKYKGWYAGGKVTLADGTRRQIFLPPEEWVMFKDLTGEIVPAIVSEKLWEAANKVLKERSEAVKSRKGIFRRVNLFTGKIVCAECGATYYRRKAAPGKFKWVCGGKLKGRSSCETFAINEEELKALLVKVVNETEPGACESAADSEFVDKYIYKILASPEENGGLKLEIKTRAGKTAVKYLKRIIKRRGRAYEVIREVLFNQSRDGDFFVKMFREIMDRNAERRRLRRAPLIM